MEEEEGHGVAGWWVWSLVVTEAQVFYSKKLSLQSGQKVAPETGKREEGKKEGRKGGNEGEIGEGEEFTPQHYA